MMVVKTVGKATGIAPRPVFVAGRSAPDRPALRFSGSRVPWLSGLLACLMVQFSGAAEISPMTRVSPGPRIVNGLATTDWPTAVSLVDSVSRTNTCGGVLVDCQTVLTAAHCVCDLDGASCQPGNDTGLSFTPGSLEIFFQNAPPVSAQSVQIPEYYDFAVRGDVALLTLATAVDGLRPTPINTAQAPAFATQGIKVGFGPTTSAGTDSGIKRSGAVSLSSCENSAFVPQEEHLCWDFAGLGNAGAPGEDSNTCGGDSGGPMFVDLGGGPVVAGITSGGSGDCEAPDASFDADVFANRAWLEARINPPAGGICGTLTPVGDTGTSVFAAGGNLDANTTEGRHTFTVEPGTVRLRVALNGDKNLDLNLSVRPMGGAALCATVLEGSFEFCDLSDPVPGTWEAVVTRFSGSAGEYQLVSTLFGTGTGSGGEVVFRDGFETVPGVDVQ